MAPLMERLKRPPGLLTIAAAAAALAVAGAVFAMVRRRGHRPGVPIQLTCEQCGHQWRQKAGPGRACPKCNSPGTARLWYRCPKCRKGFCGLEKIKLGPGRYRYRAPGTAEWRDQRPPPPACPHCRFVDVEIYSRGIPEPLTTEKAPPRSGTGPAD